MNTVGKERAAHHQEWKKAQCGSSTRERYREPFMKNQRLCQHQARGNRHHQQPGVGSS
jgi:hypothetical protein